MQPPKHGPQVSIRYLYGPPTLHYPTQEQSTWPFFFLLSQWRRPLPLQQFPPRALPQLPATDWIIHPIPAHYVEETNPISSSLTHSHRRRQPILWSRTQSSWCASAPALFPTIYLWFLLLWLVISHMNTNAAKKWVRLIRNCSIELSRHHLRV
jgi:hypothetical protein